MKQVWNHLLFAHWPVSSSEIAPLIPKGLALDLREGTPWLTISPFRVNGQRIRGLPPIPFASRFPELNVRTYVVCGGRPGIYFFSLDASSRLSVEAARRLRLPYMNAGMDVAEQGGTIRYRSKREDRRGGPAAFHAAYRAESNRLLHAAPGSLLHWLTERYCLYTTGKSGELLTVDIHHRPWPLREASLSVAVNTMTDPLGIRLPGDAQLLTYTDRLDVLFWPLRKADRQV
ncbi:YqjF family protein [Cohnella sp. JJ-181]|uniref:YqjF family protein n=1 Tax=Cohnella rhizoplanae TaxID=2974897 RepID=UPI00232D7A87|nr:DUF2071 domain-containing protein [Cohnella sp. JJ-181]